jgi:insecticidal toxin
MDRDLGQRVFANPTLTHWSVVLGHYFPLSPVPERAGVTTVDWQPAAYVSVCWKFNPDKRDLVWIRSRDLLCIHPFASGRHRGWADSIKHLDELLLLPVNDEHTLFFIYDRLAQKLCRVQRRVSAGSERWPAQWTHQWLQPDGLNDVVPVQDGYLALTDDGLFFNLTAEGEVQLGGLSERWLKGGPSGGKHWKRWQRSTRSTVLPFWVCATPAVITTCVPGTWITACCCATRGTTGKCACSGDSGQSGGLAVRRRQR